MARDEDYTWHTWQDVVDSVLAIGQRNRGVVRVLAVVTVCLIGVGGIYLIRKPDWVPTAARVERSRVTRVYDKRDRDGRGPVRQIKEYKLTCSYEVDGKVYRFSYRGRGMAPSEGTNVAIFYDPTNPSSAARHDNAILLEVTFAFAAVLVVALIVVLEFTVVQKAPIAKPCEYLALLESLCCVMGSDGKVSRREKSVIVKALADVKAPLKSEEIEAYIADFVSRVRTVGIRSVLDDAVQGLAASATQIKNKKMFLQSLSDVAKADGEVADKERCVVDKFWTVLESASTPND